jgi:hypothetical protein
MLRVCEMNQLDRKTVVDRRDGKLVPIRFQEKSAVTA